MFFLEISVCVIGFLLICKCGLYYVIVYLKYIFN